MRRLISIVTCIVICICAIVPAYAQEDATQTLSYDAAVAYNEVVQRALSEYGTFNQSIYSGVGLARLIDFDGDGSVELLIGYAVQTETTRSFYEVYGYDNEVYKLCETDCSLYTDGTAYIVIRSINGKTYLTNFEYGAFSSTHHISTIDNKQWTTYSMYSGPAIEGDYMGEYVSRINDRILTSDESGYILDIIYGDESEEVIYSAAEAEEVLAELDSIISAQNRVTVTLNSEEIAFDQPPVIVDGRTLVPVRAVIEAMNGVVEWDEATQTATLSLGIDTIKLVIGSTTAYLNRQPQILDVPPQIINGRTLLPIRFVAEKFKFNVEWLEETQTVVISK